MKYLAVMVVVCLMSVSLFAQKTKDKVNITLNDTVQVGTTRLAPGDYKVEWTGSGDNLQVSFLKGKKVVATAVGKMVDISYVPASNAILTKTEGSSVILSQIQLEKQKQALEIAQSDIAQN